MYAGVCVRGWELACAPAQGTFISGYSTALNASGASDPVTVNLYDDDVTVCVCIRVPHTHTHSCRHLPVTRVYICIYGFSGMMCRESNDFCKRIIILLLLLLLLLRRYAINYYTIWCTTAAVDGLAPIDAYLAYPYHTSFGRVVV